MKKKEQVKMNVNITTTKTENVCDSQIAHMAHWILTFISANKTTLETVGIPPIIIYNEYCLSTRFPVGVKAFAPMLHQNGLEKIHKGKSYLYVKFNAEL